ncbi:uncharacterized protein [Onthophagus taurus]|uniref:uncharacterized protein n=1 Tax=Onthophagus taurus TaxID=166361 RepID=UPI0039BE9B8F
MKVSPESTSLMNLWNVCAAFRRPKGMRTNSKRPKGVVIAAFVQVPLRKVDAVSNKLSSGMAVSGCPIKKWAGVKASRSFGSEVSGIVWSGIESLLLGSIKYKILRRLKALQDQIEALDKTQETDRETFEDKYYELVAKSKNLILNNTKIVDSATFSASGDFTNNTLNIKLPKISLPEFHGWYDKWLMFSDTFKSLTDENDQLNKTQKFYYLRSCLKGEAAQVINALEASDANYLVAWELLRNRYENKRIIVHTYVREMFELNALNQESHTHLRRLVDHFRKHLRALDSLGQPTNSWDTILIHLIVSKLDNKTKRAWECSITTTELPTLKQLLGFLIKQCILLETLDKGKATSKQNRNSCLSTTNSNCYLCKENHFLYRCDKYLKLSIKARLETIKKLNLCINCLKPNHVTKDCKAKKPIEKPAESSVVSGHTMCKRFEYVLLSTAIIIIKDVNNQPIKCRALIDSGSQSNFITKDLFLKLKLKKSNVSIPVVDINESSAKISHMTQAQISSTNENYKKKLSFLIIDKITDRLPQQNLDISDWRIPQNIAMADPEFYNPDTIEEIQNSIEKFWQLEEVRTHEKLLSEDEQYCETHFQNTHRRDEDGRFLVTLPTKTKKVQLGESLENATKRLHAMERKFTKNESLRNEYVKFLDEYKRLGHMTLLEHPNVAM